MNIAMYRFNFKIPLCTRAYKVLQKQRKSGIVFNSVPELLISWDGKTANNSKTPPAPTPPFSIIM